MLNFKGSFTPRDFVTNVTLTGKKGMQPILPITVNVKQIKAAAGQGHGDGVAWCEQVLRLICAERKCKQKRQF